MSERQGKANDGAWKAPEYKSDPYGPDAPIPETWTPDHVARRLIQAFRIDRRMPRIERPKKPGSAHPTVEYSREEMEIWEAVPIDVRRFAPTPIERLEMEVAFAWLHMIADAESLALRAWAIRQAGGGLCGRSGNSIRSIAASQGVSHVTLLKRKDRALLSIASRLNGAKEPVF